MVSGEDFDCDPALSLDEQLCSAVDSGTPNLAIIKHLLAKGASPSAMGRGQNTPVLNIAANWGHCEVIELLLEAGADINKTDTNRYNCLHAAAVTLRPSALAVLLKHPEAKSLINKRQVGHLTPLMLVVSNFSIPFDNPHESMCRCCEALLAAGADASLRVDSSGATVLMLAVKNASPEVVSLLLPHCGDINQQDNTGDSALSLAVLTFKPEAAKVLLEAGADATLQNPNSLSLFHVLANRLLNNSSYEAIELIHLLGQWGVDVNHTPEGRVLAALFPWKIDDQVLRALLDIGAQIPDTQEVKGQKEAYLRQQQAQARFDVFTAHIPPDVLSLTATDLIWFANIGRLSDAMRVSWWEGHGDHLQSLLTQLPPALAQQVVENPSIANVLHAQAASCISQPRCIEGIVAPGIMRRAQTLG